MSRSVQPSRKPIEGAPFAQWGIRAGAPLLELRATVYPAGDRGRAHVKLGEVHLNVDEKYIEVRTMGKARWSDESDLVDWARRNRNSGDFGTGLTPETITQSTMVHDMVESFDVERCTQPGCDNFGTWQRAGEPHQAHEMKGSAYHCRLVLNKGDWAPDIRIVGGNSMTVGEATGLASDLQWIVAEARRMNQREVIAA